MILIVCDVDEVFSSHFFLIFHATVFSAGLNGLLRAVCRAFKSLPLSWVEGRGLDWLFFSSVLKGEQSRGVCT